MTSYVRGVTSFESKPKWDLVGGRIKPGTPLIVNLKREVREETSLKLTGEVQILSAQDILRIKGRHVVRLSYLGKVEGTPKLNEENTEYRWFTLEEIKKIPSKDLDEYFLKILKSLKLKDLKFA